MKLITRFFSVVTIIAVFFPIIVFAQTCKKTSIPSTTPDSRFAENGNGTVTDLQTGLMWKKCPEGLTGSACETGTAAKFNWQEALKRAQEVNTVGFAGYSDWRVPNMKELKSIVEQQCYDPAINLNTFPKTISWYFWTSSPQTSANGNGGAYQVEFYQGLESWTYANDHYCYVRLVRGGQ